jgi:hypothetical protein
MRNMARIGKIAIDRLGSSSDFVPAGNANLPI